jgi:hypothetical protein
MAFLIRSKAKDDAFIVPGTVEEEEETDEDDEPSL